MDKLRIFKADINRATTNQSVILMRPWTLQFSSGAALNLRSFAEALEVARFFHMMKCAEIY